MPQNEFIDTHCHLFNIGDVPIYKMLEGQIPCGFLISIYGALGGFTGIIKKKVKQQQLLLEYMERERSENIDIIEGQMKQALQNVLGLDSSVTRIVTPLIMDFGICSPNKRLEMQERRLREAIVQSTQVQSFRVLPFLGIDLRRLHAQSAQALLNKIHQIVDDGAGNQVKRVEGISDRGVGVIPATGSFIGIKLYPPLGYCPLGWCRSGSRQCGKSKCLNDVEGLTGVEKQGLKAKYIEFFKKCERKQIPITLHCQNNGSFHLEKGKGSKHFVFTDPKRWIPILKECNNLVINFGHFSGEAEMCRTLKWRDKSPRSPRRRNRPRSYRYAGYNDDTWTVTIIKMLKLYPNTYADISAFDNKVVSRHALACILYLDEQGEFDKLLPRGTQTIHKLIDKLMWGTDRPMLLAVGKGKFPDYESQLKAFYASLDIKSVSRSRHPKPTAIVSQKNPVPAKEVWMEKLTSTNPRKFLFG